MAVSVPAPRGPPHLPRGLAGAYDFRQIPSPRRAAIVGSVLPLRHLRWAGLLAWLLVGAPILAGGHSGDLPSWLGWLGAFALFGLAFFFALPRAVDGDDGAPLRLGLALQLAALLAMALLFCDGLEGMLLVLLALQVAFVAEPRGGVAWILLQSCLLAAAISWHWSVYSALTLTPPYVGFQLLTFYVVRGLRGEAEARRRLALANGELRAAHSLVADGARLGERLRIARDLHDALGHHLVLLGLRLEAAAQAAGGEGGGAGEIQAARSLARLLLTDLGEVVAAQRQGGGFDLGGALGALLSEVREIPQPKVHLELEGDLRIEDPGLAQSLLRCAQEMVTNAFKHSGAANLWLRLARSSGGLTLAARDDGRGGRSGPRAPGAGQGLAGVRERCAAFGGTAEIDDSGSGFRVEIRLPAGEAS